MIETPKTVENERCLLAGVILSGQDQWISEEHLDELEELSHTAGAVVVGRVTQERPYPDPKFYLGKGKIEEISEFIRNNDIGMIIFDDDLSPAQIRNLEKKLEIKIVDRSSLILDIFASRARTREAKTQVELAQLQYLLPRLTRQWTHLSRQVGGIGTKGPGETQLETDRRMIRTRISKLKDELKTIEKQRFERRKGRRNIFKVALVGYTNVGKSTLMKNLSRSDVFIENKLFATLDSTVRKVYLERGKEILLSDTVGFIRKLPHHLVASFRSTLEETREADVLLHVIDASHPNYHEQMVTVEKVLKELEIQQDRVMLVFNKIDMLESNPVLSELKLQFPNATFISAIKSMGIERLKKNLITEFEKTYITKNWEFPYHEFSLRKELNAYGVILEENTTENGNHVATVRFHYTRYEKMIKEHPEWITRYESDVD